MITALVIYNALCTTVLTVFGVLLFRTALTAAKADLKPKIAHVEHRLMRVGDMSPEDKAMLMRALSGQPSDN